MTFDRPLPFDLHAEESVIAALLVSEDACARVMPIVAARDFHGEATGWAFEARVSSSWPKRFTFSETMLV